MNCAANKLIISGWIASLLTIGFLTLTFDMYLGLTDLAYMLNGAFFIVLFIGALIINRSINQNIKKSISTAANSLSLEEKKAVAQALFEAQDILDSKVVPLLRCGDNPYYASAMAKINRGFADIDSTLWVKQDVTVSQESAIDVAIEKVNNAISEANKKDREMFENMTTGQRDNKLKAVIPAGVLAFEPEKRQCSGLDNGCRYSEGKRIAVIRKIEEIPEDKSLEIYEKNLSSSEQVEKALEEWIRTHKKPLGEKI